MYRESFLGPDSDDLETCLRQNRYKFLAGKAS